MAKMRGFLNSKPKIDDAEWELAQSRTVERLAGLFNDDAGDQPEVAPEVPSQGAEDRPQAGGDVTVRDLVDRPRPPIVVDGVAHGPTSETASGEPPAPDDPARQPVVEPVGVMAQPGDIFGDDGWQLPAPPPMPHESTGLPARPRPVLPPEDEPGHQADERRVAPQGEATDVGPDAPASTQPKAEATKPAPSATKKSAEPAQSVRAGRARAADSSIGVAVAVQPSAAPGAPAAGRTSAAKPAGTSSAAKPAGTSSAAKPAGMSSAAKPAGMSSAAKPAGMSTPALRRRRPAPKRPAPVLAVAHCPYCAIVLDPAPTASRRCEQCRQRIVVKRVDGGPVYLTEAAVVVFEAERRRSASAARLTRARARWLTLAAAADAPAGRLHQLTAARLTEEVVAASKALYLTATDRAFRAARRDKAWDRAARIRRDQAGVLYRADGSHRPVAADILARYREGVGAELSGIAEISRDAELLAAGCCETCRADDHRIFRISSQRRQPRLPHEGCPRGLCRCRWDLAARDRNAMRRYLRRRPATEGVTTPAAEPVAARG